MMVLRFDKRSYGLGGAMGAENDGSAFLQTQLLYKRSYE
jgi:hypothetical protein